MHPVRLNKSKGILKIGLMERYLKNLGKRTNSLKRSRKRGIISIKSYNKAKYDTKVNGSKKASFI